MRTVGIIAEDAKKAYLTLSGLSSEVKNRALLEIADRIDANVGTILKANSQDMEFASNENLAPALVARLALTESKIKGMAKAVRSVVQLPDPAGIRTMTMELDHELILYRETCPIGVIGAIFESRPDAVPQISSLCLKSGNAVVLKGGSEAHYSNRLLVTLIREAIEKAGDVPMNSVQMIETRSEVTEMLREERNIHLIVPRGSNQFVKYIQVHTQIPVLGHADGICHGYIDDQADSEKAFAVALDSKIQYPAACNAMETLLIHEDIASKILPQLVKKYLEYEVELVGCEQSRAVSMDINPAVDDDWEREYTDLKLSIKVVSGLDEAVDHINRHGSGHTDVIVTENQNRAESFLAEVDSANVMVNASTRFADGFRYGLGSEIGISTNKTHARGPVGLEGLVIYKYKVIGDGQTVAQYSGPNAREFTHRRLDL